MATGNIGGIKFRILYFISIIILLNNIMIDGPISVNYYLYSISQVYSYLIY